MKSILNVLQKSDFRSICAAALSCMAVFFAALPGFAQQRAEVKDAVVKIYAVQSRPDYNIPWNLRAPVAVNGSGCVIAGNRILTNAHVVGDHTFIQVRLHGRPEKHQARLVAVSHEADLALLTVDDNSFFNGIAPLQFGNLPEVEQEVIVYGFPEGGDTLSTTRGVVSRIEHQRYIHRHIHLLAAQLDAAINPGNSGGPVMQGDRIAGVVMQLRKDSENIGYMVPVPVIEHFLTDLKDGRHDGIPEDGIIIQSMENESLKKMHGLTQDQTGVLVTAVITGFPAHGKIVAGDVILTIDGHAVADDGTIEFRLKERTSCDYLTQRHQIGEDIEMNILRQGHEHTVRFALHTAWGKNRLVAELQYDLRPDYYVYGGLVFCPLTLDYLLTWGENWSEQAPFNLVHYYTHENPAFAGEQVVVLIRVLPSEINRGYDGLIDERIVEVNGEKIRNLRHMIAVIENSAADEFVVFKTCRDDLIVLERAATAAEQAYIMETYRIGADRSEDLAEAVGSEESENKKAQAPSPGPLS